MNTEDEVFKNFLVEMGEKLEELDAQDLLHYGANNIYKKLVFYT